MSVKTINLTPTWEGILPILLYQIVNGTNEQKELAKKELERMSRLADSYLELVRNK